MVILASQKGSYSGVSKGGGLIPADYCTGVISNLFLSPFFFQKFTGQDSFDFHFTRTLYDSERLYTGQSQRLSVILTLNA